MVRRPSQARARTACRVRALRHTMRTAHCCAWLCRGTKTLVLQPDELSYALGKKGMTRKKLAKSRLAAIGFGPA